MQFEGGSVPEHAAGQDESKSLRGGAPGIAGRVPAESGFTLIELLVVVIIIGILAAVAIPTYLSQSEQAQAAAVQSDLRNAASSAVACASDNGGSYATCTLARLDADYDFNPSSDVDFPAASVVATATRWAAEARYAPNPANTIFHFDTDDGSQIRPGAL